MDGLPFSKIGQEVFHFEVTDMHRLLIVGAIVLGYFLTTDMVKLLYFAMTGNGNLQQKCTKTKHIIRQPRKKKESS